MVLVPIFEGTALTALISPDLTPRDRSALYRVLAYEAGRAVEETTAADLASPVGIEPTTL